METIQNISTLSQSGKRAELAAAVDSVLHDAVTEESFSPNISMILFNFGKIPYLQRRSSGPDDGSSTRANAILAMLGKTLADDLVIFLISGGGSALLTCPRPGVSLKDMQDSAQDPCLGADIMNSTPCASSGSGQRRRPLHYRQLRLYVYRSSCLTSWAAI
jgi:hypothetical protein